MSDKKVCSGIWFLPMNQLKCLILIMSLVMTQGARSQNVGINATGTAPNAAAMLDVASTTKGLLIPRVNLTSGNSNAPIGAGIVTSLMVYNIAAAGTGTNIVLPGYYYWNGTRWVAFGGSSSLNWGLLGNSGTFDATNFVGTIDSVPLNFRVNNQKAGRIDLGMKNTFFGYKAGRSITGGGSNTAFGYLALHSTTGADYGEYTDGFNNTAIGSYALFSNTDGEDNVAVGVKVLQDNIDGGSNIGLGSYVLSSNIDGGGNIGIGRYALYSNSDGNRNVAIGLSALRNNQHGFENIGIGIDALNNSTTGNNNIGIGAYVAIANNGYNNVAIGPYSMHFNSSGIGNVAAGAYSLFGTSIGRGSFNCAYGDRALYVCVGNFNTASGRGALYNCFTGNRNTAVGDSALYNVSTGSNNIGIGFNAIVPNGTLNNQIRMGNTAITYAGIQVAWTVTSDKRWKSEIKNSNLGLEFIKTLKPVYYLRNNDETKKTEYGFIAQEVEEALNKFNATNSGIINKDDKGMLSLRYNDLIAITIKAVQEQHQIILEDQEKIKLLEQRLQALEAKLK